MHASALVNTGERYFQHSHLWIGVFPFGIPQLAIWTFIYSDDVEWDTIIRTRVRVDLGKQIICSVMNPVDEAFVRSSDSSLREYVRLCPHDSERLGTLVKLTEDLSAL
ncbi:hypothetical protein V8E55_007119 [Tylopilus felleus]